jgi:hypothetical protein
LGALFRLCIELLFRIPYSAMAARLRSDENNGIVIRLIEKHFCRAEPASEKLAGSQ